MGTELLALHRDSFPAFCFENDEMKRVFLASCLLPIASSSPGHAAVFDGKMRQATTHLSQNLPHKPVAQTASRDKARDVVIKCTGTVHFETDNKYLGKTKGNSSSIGYFVINDREKTLQIQGEDLNSDDFSNICDGASRCNVKVTPTRVTWSVFETKKDGLQRITTGGISRSDGTATDSIWQTYQENGKQTGMDRTDWVYPHCKRTSLPSPKF